MRLGSVSSMTIDRRHRTLRLTFTGEIPPQLVQFESEGELLAEYDRLVAIDERERHDDA
jgi:hypothetical protein